MQIRNLFRDYGDFKINIPTWELPDQGISALSGPSGSGKTSVLRLLLGLESCPSLQWQFGDLDLAKIPVEHRRLGVVFQNYELFRHMTARENIEFAALARKIEPTIRSKTFKELNGRLRLDSFLDRKPLQLSGGERQRVALARALIGQPRFLFLDEPFSALDTQLRSEARLLVKSIVEEFKIPTLLVSHDPADVEVLAQQVTQIENGHLKS
jgi:sulfate transport system ATP-binding protein/putative spermidine/putrescine transport system ATP-binding protein